ncbi:MAG: hypothetical protein ACUZ8O_06455 [Candidatus Anammoxibacter sp.]
MIEPPKRKHLKGIFDQLSNLQEDTKCFVSKPNSSLDMIACNVSKNLPGRYSIEFENPNNPQIGLIELENLVLNGKNYNYYVETVYMTSISRTAKGVFFEFSTKEMDRLEEYHYRLIIMLDDDLFFRSYFADPKVFETTEGYSSINCIDIDLDGKNFDLFSMRKHGNAYLIIDCDSKVNIEYFSEACHAILICFGFVTGNMPQEDGFYFAYTNDSYNELEFIHYNCLNKTVKSIYHPIHTNPYAYTRNPKIAQEFSSKLTGIGKGQFSELCKKTFFSSEMLSTLYFIIHGSTLSVELMASCYAIALESITNIISLENEKKLKPIKDKKIARKLHDDFIKVLNKHIPDDKNKNGKDIIIKNIENINRPTNRDKLYKPFEILGISLNDEDIKAIDYRNVLLHGRLINSEQGLEKECNSTFHIALKLYFLVSSLVLKSVGFSGYILNFPKIHENIKERKVNEPFYRKI